jgi:hypothetical protein
MSDEAQAIDAIPHPDDRPLGPILGLLAAEIAIYTVLSLIALASVSLLMP